MKCANSIKEMVRLLELPYEIKEVGNEVWIYINNDTTEIDVRHIDLFLTPCVNEFYEGAPVTLRYSVPSNAFVLTVGDRLKNKEETNE